MLVSTENINKGLRCKEKDTAKLYPERIFKMNYKRTMYKRNSACRSSVNTKCNRMSVCSDNNRNERNSDCAERKSSLAMVYGIKQSWRDINDGCDGFRRGTIFGELNKPFMGDKCKRGGCGK